jgi:diguanylate cyclase (GGDEF)-like protein
MPMAGWMPWIECGAVASKHPSHALKWAVEPSMRLRRTPYCAQLQLDRRELPPVSVDRSADGRTEPRAVNSWFGRVADAFLGIDSRRRIRIAQWLISVSVYVASAFVLWFGLRHGRMDEEFFIGWCVFLATGLSVFYFALRSGWSERFMDPALTAAQIVLGVIGVEWGYLMCGPVRGVTLFPLLLIFAFGAFSLSWRRIMWLTLFALASLVATVVALNGSRSGLGTWSLDNADLRLDLTNVLMIMILLPALSLVAARLSSLRFKLQLQRAALTEALEEVQRLATHDELTGLANRRHMQERLAQEQYRFLRQGHPFCIAIIDLDNFKQINDEHGHAAGDQVLRAFATEAIATLRSTDLFARWGGEEFLLLLPDTRGLQALASLQRMLTRIRMLPHETGVGLTFSAGVTEHRRDETVADTIARADRGMYEAKSAGRNTVRLQGLAVEGSAVTGRAGSPADSR